MTVERPSYVVAVCLGLATTVSCGFAIQQNPNTGKIEFVGSQEQVRQMRLGNVLLQPRGYWPQQWKVLTDVETQ